MPKPKTDKPLSDAKNHETLRREYAEWLFDRDRSGTQQEWAAANGVHEVTVSRWKRHPDVIAYGAAFRERMATDFALATLNMVRIAMGRGSEAVSAYRVLADVLGENAPKKIEQTGTTGVQEIKVTWPDYDQRGKVVPLRSVS